MIGNWFVYFCIANKKSSKVLKDITGLISNFLKKMKASIGRLSETFKLSRTETLTKKNFQTRLEYLMHVK
ncbi:hypothetical protein JTE90_022671 [Oedothorax gibbosus]|uniref:Uncharacterized protein n=1 Tax=Oedothorax gibbosus TaxID=931172 RepID=A0AAV6UJM6_9ARAC|nr:hypothetical protein JTE90_022671 [Oedothorax gibbosus]